MSIDVLTRGPLNLLNTRQSLLWSSTVNDDTNDSVAAIFIAPKDGIIDSIFASISGAVTGSPTFTIALKDATIGTGAQWEPGATTHASESYAPSGSPGGVWHTLSSPYSVSAGELVVVHITGGTTGNEADFNYGHQGHTPGYPSTAIEASGTWSNQGYSPALAIRYSDGTIPLGAKPANDLSTASPAMHTSGSIDEAANIWTPDRALRIIGIACEINCISYSSDYQVGLIDPTFTDEYRRSQRVDASLHYDDNRVGWTFVEFAPYEVTKGRQYRLSVLALGDNSGDSIRVGFSTFPDADTRLTVCGDLYRSTRLNGGSWTDETAQVSSILPVIEEMPSANRVFSIG